MDDKNNYVSDSKYGGFDIRHFHLEDEDRIVYEVYKDGELVETVDTLSELNMEGNS